MMFTAISDSEISYPYSFFSSPRICLRWLRGFHVFQYPPPYFGAQIVMVIEFAAYKGKKIFLVCVSIGKVGCLSTQTNKHISFGDGELNQVGSILANALLLLIQIVLLLPCVICVFYSNLVRRITKQFLTLSKVSILQYCCNRYCH